MPDPTPKAPLDVFISYAREDRQTAEKLALALQGHGISVWWDREILGGAEFSEVIERELTRARVALVLWSAPSVQSSFVRDESARARDDGKLLPVRIEDIKLPLGFGQIHTLDLIDWDGDDDAPALAELVAHVQRRLKGEVAPPTTTARGRVLPVRRNTLLAGGAALAAAGAGWFGWTQWFTRDTERAQQLTVQGVDKFEARQFVPARLLFNQALVADDQYAPALFYRAQVLIQDGAPQEAAADLRVALELRQGLDGGQLRDAGRWLAELGAGTADPAPVTRVAAADPEPAPAAGAPVAAPAPAPADAPAPTPAPLPPPSPRPAAGKPPLSSSGGVNDMSDFGGPTPPKAIAPTRPGAAPPPRPAAITQAPAPVAAPPPPPVAVATDTAGGAPRSLPLPAAARDRLAGVVEQMFSPSKPARLAATTGLIVDAEAGSDAVPLAVARALQAQRAGARDEAARAGVINVLTLLQSASPATLALHADEIRRLLDSARSNGPQTAELVTSVAASLARAEKLRPLVYLQIASDAQRALAAALAARLRAGGYRVPAVEVVGPKAPTRTELRVQGRSDQGLARWMAKAAAEVTGAPVDVKTLRGAKPNEDTFEFWLDAKLCTGGGLRPAACAG